ncbi:MAG TPA: hypothetical protein VHV26_06455 [Rhizomicrobium sp.]|nr:hypothetical protein [Rhizomicrobium sp.]
MSPDDLVARYPRLYHMAHQGSWPAIREHGLLSTKALLDLYQVVGPDRGAVETARRPALAHISRPGLPGATIRDQKPMSDSALRKCLQDGLEPSDWYKILNGYSYFWLSPGRVRKLLQARAYRDSLQTVLVLDTAGLVTRYEKRIRLSAINSGSTIRNALPRGLKTFLPIAEFPFAERAKRRALADNVVELVIDHSVPDVATSVRTVWEVRGPDVLREIYRSPQATLSDGFGC